MNMVKKSTLALLFLLGIGLSSSSSVSSSKDYPQFLPKIQAESSSYKELYRSARIYVEINSASGDMDDLLEDLEGSAYKAAEILPQVLFVKPQAQPLKLGEKNLCKSIQLDNFMKLKEFETDLAVFFSLSNNFIKNSTSAKVCEYSSDNQVKSIEIKVDRKIYQGLDEDKKVSLLSKAIISAIFNSKSEKYVKEIEESLENLKYQPIFAECTFPCITCSSSPTTCSSCDTGYYLSGSTCLACQPQCNSCVNSAMNCLVCSDTLHMSDPPTCACPPNSILAGGNCVCAPGYYYDSNNDCSPCESNCATCDDDATDCETCIDSVHMTAAPACSCPSYSSLVQGSCTCNFGYFYSSNTNCAACNPNCVTCVTTASNCLLCTDSTHMSAAPACACPANSSIIGGFCTCNSGYYYSSNTVCSACDPQCSACTAASYICSSCTDQVHSSGAPYCSCPGNSTLVSGSCACNTGYYFSSNTVCTACQANCATCTPSIACVTCLDPIHMTAPPKCHCPDNSYLLETSCVCNPGYYYSNVSTCSPCQSNCGSCSGSASSCLTCIDTVHMSSPPSCVCPASSTFTGGQCVCNAGYHYSSPTVCSACALNCATCSTSTNCLTCIDTVHMTAAPTCSCPSNSILSNNVCTCINGYFYQTTTTCAACNSNCATCSNSASNCITCIDTTHMTAAPACVCPSNSILSAGSCICNPGYYFSSPTVCSACAINCATCNTGTACITCSDTVHMSAAPTCSCPSNSILSAGSCICNSGFFYSSGSATTCTACQNNCATCSNTASNCITCTDTTHMTAAPACACPANSAVNASGQCVCYTGYYFSNNQCSTCYPQCSACSVSASTCSACIDTVHMGNPPTCACPVNSYLVAGTCTCNTGFYFSTNTICSACAPQCASCYTTQANCGTCVDTVHMSAAPACACPANGSLVGNICVCNIGYYYSSATVCAACQSNCASCDSNPSTCDTCKDTVHMSAAPGCSCPYNSVLIGSSCACITGYFYSSNTVCSACQTNCQTCATSATACVTCSDTIHMTAAPACACPALSSLVNGSCVCNAGYYFSSTSVCSSCNNNCAGCTNSATNCNACVDTTHMSAPPTCACPANAYLNGNTCQCNPGYYYSNPKTCTPNSECPPQCAQCSSDSFCTACNDPDNMYLNPATGTCRCWDQYATFNQTTGTCQCMQGYYLSNSGVCQICMSPCAQCSTSATFCTECDDFDNMNLNIATGSCSCKDSDYQFNPWVKACQPNPSCNCTSCEINIYNYNNITNVTNVYS